MNNFSLCDLFGGTLGNQTSYYLVFGPKELLEQRPLTLRRLCFFCQIFTEFCFNFCGVHTVAIVIWYFTPYLRILIGWIIIWNDDISPLVPATLQGGHVLLRQKFPFWKVIWFIYWPIDFVMWKQWAHFTLLGQSLAPNKVLIKFKRWAWRCDSLLLLNPLKLDRARMRISLGCLFDQPFITLRIVLSQWQKKYRRHQT